MQIDILASNPEKINAKFEKTHIFLLVFGKPQSVGEYALQKTQDIVLGRDGQIQKTPIRRSVSFFREKREREIVPFGTIISYLNYVDKL